MSVIVAVAGGTSKLGRDVLGCLGSSEKFQVLVLARKVCVYVFPDTVC